MLLKNKLDKLKKQLNKENILSEPEECCCYAEDAYNMTNEGKIPDLVVFVQSVNDIQKVMRFAYENEIPVISRGAGTNMVGACTCVSGGIVLNFSKMNKIIDMSSENMTITVEPGAILQDIKNTASNAGLFFPPDPSNYKVSTIGGAIAQSSGGALSFKYGTIKDYVLSLKVVTADGNLLQLGVATIKNATGYHLAQLMVGSEGTLAIIAEATLKLIPKPEKNSSVLAYFDTADDAVDAINSLITSNICPSAIDFMDNNAIKTVESYANCGLNTQKSCLLLIELDGLTSAVKEQILKTNNVLKKYTSTDIIIAENEADAEKLWQARRVSYSATAKLAPDVISDDIIVPRKNLKIMIQECQKTAKKYNLKMSLIGHIGDGNLHPQIALNLENEEELKILLKAKKEMYDMAIRLGGAISGEHGIGIEKREYFQNSTDNLAIDYMKAIKKVFDCKNILNPGKIF